jgi:hypothetical protein
MKYVMKTGFNIVTFNYTEYRDRKKRPSGTHRTGTYLTAVCTSYCAGALCTSYGTGTY